MRLLFDPYLSSRLVGLLSGSYPDSVHVREVDLDEADDAEDGRYAAVHGLAIVSKDSDFHRMSLLYGPPPRVVWLRVGNGPTRTIVDLLEKHRARYHAALIRGPGGSVSGTSIETTSMAGRVPPKF